MQKVLLTGGAGFIGSHIAQALLKSGKRVAIVDNLDDFYPVTWKRGNLQSIAEIGSARVFESDVRDPVSLSQVFEQTQPQTVIHLAAKAGVRPSIEAPGQYYDVNVRGTLNILQMCEQYGVSNVIFGSSSSVYGCSDRVPFSEKDTTLRPVSPYAASKISAELLCYTFAHLYGIRTICLRFFTVYGPRQRPDLAIHKFTSLLEAGFPIPLYGNGLSGRDFTYIDDIVAGLMSSIEYADASARGEYQVFNLGSSTPILLNDLVRALEKATGTRATVRYEPEQPGDVRLTCADLSKSAEMLGYHPSADFEAGLKTFVEWYRKVKLGSAQVA
jgi:UDP-glucuronate 4-epimerase